MTTKRVLPHNLDAEASILGGIMLRNQIIGDLVDLEPGDFYDPRHRLVFAAMRNLEAAAKPIDPVTVETELDRMGKLEAVGGIFFLGELGIRVPTADNVMAYAEIVRNKHHARKVMLVAGEIAERGYDDDMPLEEYLDDSEAAMLEATSRRSKADEAIPIGGVLKQRIREIDAIVGARARGEVAMTGAPTGVPALDRLIGGWQFGIVQILAGRPAMGKTSTACATAEASAEVGYGVHVFTLEEPRSIYADRALSRRSRVAADRIRNGDLQRQDLTPITQAMAGLSKLSDRWIIDDRGGLSAREIIRSVRRHRAKNRTRVVIVDHLQIVGRTRGLDENAALEEIVNAFAAAAKDEDEDGKRIAWVVLCQLNRKVEERTDRRPQLADLRGSGAIEASARMVVAQYRGSYYGSDPKPDIDYDCSCPPKTPAGACSHRPGDDEFRRQVQLIIIKNNTGPTGRIFAEWDAQTMRVE